MSELARALRTVAGATPEAEYEPSSLAELAAIMRNDDGRTLVPVGAGTQLDLGRPPNRPFALVHLSRALAGEVQHQPADLTATVPAGVTFGALERVLAARGQRLPLDPPLAPMATMGGVLAVGTGGPLRSRYGLPRDFVLGMTVMRADGELVRAGGRVVKNVTGYDFMRLWCGSLGTLGIIVSANLRVMPIAETEDLILQVESAAAGLEIIRSVYQADLRPEIADLSHSHESWSIFLRLPAAAALTARARLGAGASAAGPGYEQLRDAGFVHDDELTLRVSVPAGQVERVCGELQTLGPAGIILRPLAGIVRAWWTHSSIPVVSALAATVSRLRDSLVSGGGSVVIERLPEALRPRVDPWGPPPPGFDLMRRAKQTFDPGGRLAAGRYVGGL